MHVVYREGDEGEPRRWPDWDPWELAYDDGLLIEDAGPWASFDEWYAMLIDGSLRARRAGLWFLLQLEQPGLPLDDVKPRPGDLVFIFSKEAAAIAAAMGDADAAEAQAAAADGRPLDESDGDGSPPSGDPAPEASEPSAPAGASA